MQVYQLDKIKHPAIEHDEFTGFKSPASNYFKPRLSIDEKCHLDNPVVYLIVVEVEAMSPSPHGHPRLRH